MSSLAKQSRLERRWWLVLLAFALAPVGPAGAQEEAGGQRVFEELLRVRLDQQLPRAREIGVDAGGWFNFTLFNFDDASARRERTLRRYALRGWAAMDVRGVHQAYVRGLLDFKDWNAGDHPQGDDFQETLERAWYQLDLGQIERNRTGREPPLGLRVKVGREFATIGTALALATPLDMVRFDLSVGELELMALLGQSVNRTRNIDRSERVWGEQDRCFWGVELAYRGLSRHRPFAYFLSNQDNTTPRPDSPFQSYEYTSHYVGVGSEGTVLLPDLRYQVEVVGEWGKTYSEGVSAGRDRVRAMALDVLLEYLSKGRTRPKLTLEYLFGSGDSDRRLSSSSTIGGNRPGTRDKAFNAFGFRDTGLAFSPRISNIHIYKLGASCFPLENVEPFKKMELGTSVFFYHKAKDAGAVSDTTAVNDAQWLGWEWDVFCDWRLTSDLAWTIRYGAFQPGSAFPRGDDSCRQFLYTGLVYSF